MLRVLRTEVRGGICASRWTRHGTRSSANRRATLQASAPQVHAVDVSGAGKVLIERLSWITCAGADGRGPSNRSSRRP